MADKNYQIDVEELKSRLLRQKTIRKRFRLPLASKQMTDVLLAAVMAETEYRSHAYKDSDEMRHCIRMVSDWMTNSSKIGLMLCGRAGNGKTTMMKAIVSVIGLFDLKDSYGESMRVTIREVGEIVRTRKEDYQSYRKVIDCPILAIDDLGTEPADVMDYGNVLSPMTELIMHRYNEQLCTIATTNLTGSEIRKKYGDRVADRFNEMMAVVIFKGDSYRGK